MKKIILLLTALITMSCISFAQITVTIPEIILQTPGSNVSVPIDVTNFNDIAAITLRITYDPAVLSFQGSPNPLPGNFVINASNGTVIIAWISLTPLNLGSGKLFDINFKHIAGNTDLTFSTNACEIANISAEPLNVTYQNGKVIGNQSSSQKASIGNKVFIDANKNGMQDNDEAGLEWVTVDLYDCNDGWKAWALTNSDGEFSFTDIEPGDYYLKFYLIDDNSVYTFSPKDAGNDDAADSDAERLDDSTGRTACTNLSAGENDLSWDVGVYIGPPIIDPGDPELVMTITDGKLLMPDSGKTTTYTIYYENKVGGVIVDASIIDSLPKGLKFISASGGAVIFGSTILFMDLGTLDPGEKGSFTTVVEVTSSESKYLNKVFLSGKDSQDNLYLEYAEDLNLRDSTGSGGSTSIDTENNLPGTFRLEQNFPNPFNPSTIIEYAVPLREMVTLKVYDMLGKEIAELVNEELNPGRYSITFNASTISSGVYFYKLQSNSINITKKMTFAK